MNLICEDIETAAGEIADKQNRETVCQAIDRYRVATHWQELGYFKFYVECCEFRFKMAKEKNCVNQLELARIELHKARIDYQILREARDRFIDV